MRLGVGPGPMRVARASEPGPDSPRLGLGVKFNRREAHWQSPSGIAVSRPVNHEVASVRVLRIPT